MWLVLCEAADVPARWACAGLHARGLDPVELVTSDQLAHARWLSAFGAKGPRAEVRLRDGRVLAARSVRGVLNRLVRPPQGDLMLVQPSDRDYVLHELMAVLSGWLGAVAGPVLGRPAPECLCGRVRSAAEWTQLAVRAGLGVPTLRVSSGVPPPPPSLRVRLADAGCCPRAVCVVGDRVSGDPVPEHVADGCRRLAALAGAAPLGLELTVSAGGDWSVAGVDALPDLRRGGEGLLDALAADLRRPEGAAA